MKRLTSSLSLLILCATLNAQDNPISVFENIAGSTWISEGTQLGGHEGKTVKEISLGLDGKVIKVTTSTTDPQTGIFGLRNEGIRTFNTATKQLEFYEFDKFGGVTQGVVIVDGKDIHYQYEYGELTLRDSWIYVNNDEYLYIVASWKDGKQDQQYHKGSFKRK